MWIWKSGGMGDSSDDEARVSAVDPRQGVVEADRGSAGDAGGPEEHPAFPAAGGELAGVLGGDGGFPVVERRARYPWFCLFAAFTVAMMNGGTVARSAAAPRR